MVASIPVLSNSHHGVFRDNMVQCSDITNYKLAIVSIIGCLTAEVSVIGSVQNPMAAELRPRVNTVFPLINPE